MTNTIEAIQMKLKDLLDKDQDPKLKLSLKKMVSIGLHDFLMARAPLLTKFVEIGILEQ